MKYRLYICKPNVEWENNRLRKKNRDKNNQNIRADHRLSLQSYNSWLVSLRIYLGKNGSGSNSGNFRDRNGRGTAIFLAPCDERRGRKISARRVRPDGEIIENGLSHRRTKEIFHRPTNSLVKWAGVQKKITPRRREGYKERENKKRGPNRRDARKRARMVRQIKNSSRRYEPDDKYNNN